MKLKRTLLLVGAGVELLIIIIYFVSMLKAMKQLDNMALSYNVELMGYCNTILGALRTICIFAVADFLFCVGAKSFNKSMLGISVGLFTLQIAIIFVTLFLQRVFYTPSNNMALIWYFVWQALITIPFVALAVAYVVVKSCYRKRKMSASPIF